MVRISTLLLGVSLIANCYQCNKIGDLEGELETASEEQERLGTLVETNRKQDPQCTPQYDAVSGRVITNCDSPNLLDPSLYRVDLTPK
ncbi:TPA: hypothetical protein HA241_05170 [Candidatus Woesearchaeota archaeon]|nr:hypothetical protein [Candidatus Woesearchaeota archaeon]